VTTPQLVRLCLEHHRALGLPFADAWNRALQSIPRGPNAVVARERAEWASVLKATRDAWQEAYESGALDGALSALEPAVRDRRLELA
jgi:hypothetical protein